jgi:hypothetical protein
MEDITNAQSQLFSVMMTTEDMDAQRNGSAVVGFRNLQSKYCLQTNLDVNPVPGAVLNQ